MVQVAVGPAEAAVTLGTRQRGYRERAWRQRLLEGLEVLAFVPSETGLAPLAVAGMMGYVFGVVTPVVLVAKVRLGQETRKGVAPVVMPVFFEQENQFSGGRGRSDKGSMEMTLIW